MLTRPAQSHGRAPKVLSAIDSILRSHHTFRHGLLLCTTPLDKGCPPTRFRPPNNDSKHIRQMLGSISQDSDSLNLAHHMTPPPVSGLQYETQEGSTLGDGESLIPLERSSVIQCERRERSSRASTQLAQEARPPSIPGSPVWMIKLINWTVPAEQACGGGGHGAASTSGLGLGGGSCVVPGRQS